MRRVPGVLKWRAERDHRPHRGAGAGQPARRAHDRARRAAGGRSGPPGVAPAHRLLPPARGLRARSASRGGRRGRAPGGPLRARRDGARGRAGPHSPVSGPGRRRLGLAGRGPGRPPRGPQRARRPRRRADLQGRGGGRGRLPHRGTLRGRHQRDRPGAGGRRGRRGRQHQRARHRGGRHRARQPLGRDPRGDPADRRADRHAQDRQLLGRRRRRGQGRDLDRAAGRRRTPPTERRR